MEKEIELSKEQIEARGIAIGSLQNAMTMLGDAILECDSVGLSLSDSFEAIGMEIPKMLRPMVNQLADRLPSRNPDFVQNDT